MGLLLRHAVVITSMEEDFRRIGLIQEERPDEGEDVLVESEETDESDYDLGFDDDKDEAISKARSDDDEDDETDESDESDEGDEDAAMAEAVAFHESAKAMWQEFGEDGIEAIDLDSEQMATLEGMGDTTTLPGDVIDETIDEDDEDEAIDEDEDEGEDEGEDIPNPFESVSEAMSAIEAILDEDARPTDSLEEATPAFANLALISEKLYGFFTETAEAQDDAEYAEIAEAYKNIAQYSAAIVDTLKTEDADTINFEALTETFQDYLKTVLQGLETFAILREADEGEGEGEDEDEDEGEGEDEEQDEDNEGNG